MDLVCGLDWVGLDTAFIAHFSYVFNLLFHSGLSFFEISSKNYHTLYPLLLVFHPYVPVEKATSPDDTSISISLTHLHRHTLDRHHCRSHYPLVSSFNPHGWTATFHNSTSNRIHITQNLRSNRGTNTVHPLAAPKPYKLSGWPKRTFLSYLIRKPNHSLVSSVRNYAKRWTRPTQSC